MSFQNLQFGRVMRAVLIVAVMGAALSFGACYCFLVIELMPDIDTQANMSAQQQEIQERMPDLMEEMYTDPPSSLNTIHIVQLALVVLLAFWQAHWAALRATTPQEAMGYAIAVGMGILFTYGLFLLLFAPAHLAIKASFYVAVLAACAWAGRVAGSKAGRAPIPAAGAPFEAPTYPPSQLGMPPMSGRPDVYYNMGVQAALSARRDEARQHFTRALQMNPRFVAAWLQLANLADSPERAWDYIQQARAISPNDPAVLQAVSLIWPQIEAKAAAAPPPRAQPPYPGAETGAPGIPRSTLPDVNVAPPAQIVPPTPPPVDAPPAPGEPGPGETPPAE